MAHDSSLDRVTVGITVESKVLTPEQISERVGAEWDEARRIGEPRGHLGEKWERNVWRIFERQSGAENVNAHALLPVCLENFLGRLAPISNKLHEISDSEGGEFFISVTAKDVPGINFTPESLRILAESGVSMDIDIILYGDDGDDAGT